MDDFVIFATENNGQLQDVVSVLPHEYVFESGLAPEAIVGVLAKPLSEGGKLEPGNFVRNSVFVSFLHQFIAEHAPNDSEFQKSAGRQSTGHIYFIDSRTPMPEGNVPREDIIGVFSVENGTILGNSYQPNSRHFILSDAGFFKLSPTLMSRLCEELKALPERGPAP